MSRSLIRGLPLLVLLLAPVSASAQAAFLGPESCKGCHAEAYEAWQRSPHARAQSSLSGQQARDGRCLSCHAPQAKDGLAAVSCESCHGAGQLYSPRYVMKDAELARLVGLEDPSEKGCKACHDASSPSLTPFDFKKKLAAIDHWSAGRKRRKQTASVEDLERVKALLATVPAASAPLASAGEVRPKSAAR